MQSSSPLPRVCASGAEDLVVVLLPPLLGGIRDGAGDPALPNSAWGTLPPVCLCCRQGWPQRCTLPAACTLPAPLSPRNLRALPQAGHTRGGSQTPSPPRSSHPRPPLSRFSPHSLPFLPLAAGAGLREQGDIVRGCRAQVLGFPSFPHPPPCWGPIPGCVRDFH